MFIIYHSQQITLVRKKKKKKKQKKQKNKKNKKNKRKLRQPCLALFPYLYEA